MTLFVIFHSKRNSAVTKIYWAGLNSLQYRTLPYSDTVARKAVLKVARTSPMLLPRLLHGLQVVVIIARVLPFVCPV